MTGAVGQDGREGCGDDVRDGMARNSVLHERRRVLGDVWARGQAGEARMAGGC